MVVAVVAVGAEVTAVAVAVGEEVAVRVGLRVACK